MTRRPVAFLDSGIGGLPYLAAARLLLPSTPCVYLADRENFPYGDRTPERITAAVTAAVQRLLTATDPRVVVIACNTASVVALPALRARFDLPFVGVVPAVKTAAASAPGGRFGVLATQQTVEGEYLRGLVASHAAGCTVVALPAAALVRFVEEDLLGSTRGERLARVAVEVARLKDERIRTLVLGCTHFLHLEEEFREVLAREGITVVDSREGVARQVARLAVTGWREGGQPDGAGADAGARVAATAESRPQCMFHVTGQEPVESRYSAFAERFGLAWGGILP